jgi:hypothetical protein
MLSEWDDDKLNDSNSLPLFKEFITREIEFLQKYLSDNVKLNQIVNYHSFKPNIFEERLKIMQKITPYERVESEKVLSITITCYLHNHESIITLQCLHKILTNNEDFELDEEICEIIARKLKSIDTNLNEKLEVLKISLILISRKMSNELESAILEALKVGNLSFEANICDSIDWIKIQKLKYKIYELLLIHHNRRDITFLSKWLSEVSTLFDALEPNFEDSIFSVLFDIYKSHQDQTPGCLAKALLEKLIDKKSVSK